MNLESLLSLRDDVSDILEDGLPGFVFCEVPIPDARALLGHPCPHCGRNVMGSETIRRQDMATLLHGDPSTIKGRLHMLSASRLAVSVSPTGPSDE